MCVCKFARSMQATKIEKSLKNEQISEFLKDWWLGDVLPESTKACYGSDLRPLFKLKFAHGILNVVTMLPRSLQEYKHFAQLVGNTTLEPMVKGAIDRAIAKVHMSARTQQFATLSVLTTTSTVACVAGLGDA